MTRDEIAAAVLVRDGRVLLCHRSPHREHYPNVWDLPGGHVEPGESPAGALTRELTEELGIAITPPPGPPRAVVETDAIHMRVWVVDSWTGSVVNAAPDEHDQLRWASPAETRTLDLAHPAYGPLFADVLGG